MANLTATPGCTTSGVGFIDLAYTGTATPASFTFKLFVGATLYLTIGPTTSSTRANDVANNTYDAYVYDDLGAEIGSTLGVVVDCAPPVVINSVTVTNATAYGASNGSATVNASGGKAPLSYSKDNTTWQTSNIFSNLAAGSYTAYVKDSSTTPKTAQQAFTVSQPPAGVATPPAAKYMAVGGTLSNPIEYTFSFAVNDPQGNAKTGHYVKVNIYRAGQTTPFASTKQRVRNGAAKVDVARFVKSLVSSRPTFNNSLTVTTDPNAMAGFTIGFIEYFGTITGTITMAEVKENTVKYAVNAALQSLDGNYVEHVIQAV